MTIPRTIAELITDRLTTDPGQPLVTAYDDATGERAELSVTTYANWVSKTANLFTDELGLDAGDTVLLDLPPHWLVPVFLGAAWSAGLAVTTDPLVSHDLVVCGPDTLTRHQDADQVLACALLPFAVRFASALPTGVLDYGLLWPGQSDVFLALNGPGPDTIGWRSEGRLQSHGELLREADLHQHPAGIRLLTDVHPAHDRGIPVFLAPLMRHGSLVLVSHPTESSWEVRTRDERASAVLRAYPPSE